MNEVLKNIYQAIIEGDLATAQTEVRGAIEAAGLRDRVKIIVGGAPVTAESARRIGADGFAPDASQAGVVATTLISQ